MLRWRFPDPSESRARAEVVSRIDAWWIAFAARADDLNAHFSRGREMDIPGFMQEHLQAIDDRLMWEYGPPVQGTGHRLVITPESDRQLRPLVSAILDRAPSLSGWEFYPYRLSEDVASALGSVKGRTGVDFKGTMVRILDGPDSRIGLEFHSPSCRHPEDDTAQHTAFVAVENLVGEEVLDHWIGEIRAVPLRKPGLLSRWRGRAPDEDLLPLERLKSEVDARIERALARLPDSPRYLLDNEGPAAPPWSSYTLEPRDREDYPNRSDLYVAISGFKEFFQEAHGHGIFSSRRLSRFGETFCYLKIDGVEGFNECKFADREAIESAIDAVLRPAEAGGTIGGGTGRRYSYIDLALLDTDGAIPILRKVLRGGKIPTRSWLLFFDDELSDEWVGMWEDTPGPPREEAPS